MKKGVLSLGILCLYFCFSLNLKAQADIAPNNIQTGPTFNHSNVVSKSKLNSNKAVLDSEFTYYVQDSIAAFKPSATLGGNAGVIYFNNEFWVSKWAGDTIVSLDHNGTVTSQFTIPRVSGTRSFTTDGTSIFIGNATDSIYAINPITRTLDSMIVITGGSVGTRVCAYDPTADNGNGGFWIANFTSDIQLISRTGVVLNSIAQATHGIPSMYGGFVDTSTAGGPYLAVYHQGTSRDAIIEYINIPSGTNSGIFYDTHFDLLGTQSPLATEDPIAGGLFLSDQYSAGKLTLIGVLQGLPDILFGLDYVTPTCPNPTGLGSMTQPNGDITLSWTGSAPNHNLIYGPVGFTRGMGTKISNVTSPYTLPGLPLNATYEFRVEDSCGVGNSSYWSFPQTFSTPANVPYLEDFETFPAGINANPWPKGWSSTTTSITRWESQTSDGTDLNSTSTGPAFDNTNFGLPGGTYVYLECSGTTNLQADLVSEPIQVDPSYDLLKMEFAYHMFGQTMGDLEIYVDTNGVSDFIGAIKGEQHDSIQAPWSKFKAIISGYEGKSIQLRFRGIRGSDYYSDMSIDDIIIDTLPPVNASIVDLQNPSNGAFCSGTTTPVVNIQNAGSTVLNSVKILWSVNGVLDSVTYSNPLQPGAITAVSLGSINLNSSTTYDLKFYTKDPNNLTDEDNSDDTLSIENVVTSLSGTFTLDASLPASTTNFISFSSLAQELNARGICGPLTVNVAPGVYNDVFELNNVFGTSPANRITIDGGDSSLVTLENDLSSTKAIVDLIGTSYTTIKNMTVNSLYTGTSDHFGVHLGGGFSSNYDSLINLHVIMDPTNTSTANGIAASASSTNDLSEGDNANHTTVMNCYVEGGSYAFHFEGGSTGNWNVGNSFINNTAFNMDDYGFYFDEQDSISVIGNTTTGNRSTGGDGIYAFDCVNFKCNGNFVHAPDYGIYWGDANSDKTPDIRAELINNMVISDTDYGIYMTDALNVNVWHNTVYVEASSSDAFYVTGSLTDNLDVRNNIFSSLNSPAFETAQPDTVFIKFDYNIFYTTGTNLLNIDGTLYTDLASYQTAQPLLNNSSLSGDPSFVSTTDLRIIGSLPNDVGDNSVGVLTDIEGDTRPFSGSTIVDIGADEFEPAACLPPSNQNTYFITADSVTLVWDGAGNTYQYEIVELPNAQGSGTKDVTPLDSIRVGDLSPTTNYEFYVREICGRSDTSLWIGPLTFTTPCAAFTAPYSENFDGVSTPDLPDCWSELEPATSTIQTVSTTDHGVTIPSSPNAVEINDNNGTLPIFLVSPAFSDLPNANFRVNVDIAYEGSTDVTDDTLFVGVMTDPLNPATFVHFDTVTKANSQANFAPYSFEFNNPSKIGSATYVAFEYVEGDGGYEFYIDNFSYEEVVPLNAGVVDLVSPSFPLCPGTVAPTVGVKNLGTDPITTVKVLWSVNGVLDSVTYNTQILPGDTADVTLGNITFNGTSLYDLAFYTKDPNNGSDMINLDDTLSFEGLRTGLSGNFTIDSNSVASASNWVSFTDFANDVSAYGICGPVIVDVVPNSGPYNEQIILGDITGSSSTNTITLKGNGNTLAFGSSNSNQRAVIAFDNASWVTVDSLYIDATGDTYGWGVHITGSSHHISLIKDSIITDQSSSSSSAYAAVVITGSNTSLTADSDVENVWIDQCTLIGGYYGITARSSSGNVSNYAFTNNAIQDFYSYGIYLQHSDSVLIERNDISRPTRSSFSTLYGIAIVTDNDNTIVNANSIHNIAEQNTSSTSAAYPIYGAGDATIGNECYVTNNLIYDINCNGTIYGIYDTGSDGMNYYNNTVSLDYTASTSGTTRGFYQSSASTNSSFINNLITIARGGSGTKHGIYLSASATSINVDYNNVFLNSAGSGSQYYGYYSGNESTLADWQANTSYGANSRDADPSYVNLAAHDLTPTSSFINAIALSLPQVSEDFNGVARGANPDIGAIEFNPPAIDNLGLTTLTSPVESTDSCYGASEDVIVTLLNSGGTAIDFTTSNTDITVNVSGAITQTLNTTLIDNSINGGVPLAIGTSINVNMGTINMTTPGSYDFEGYVDLTSDNLPSDDTLNTSVSISAVSGGLISGTDTICQGDTTTLTTDGYVGRLQWQELDGGNWIDIVGADSSSIDVDPAMKTDYRVIACGTAISDTFTVVPNITVQPTVTSKIEIVNCGDMGTDTLIATSSTLGAEFNWYDQATGGNLIQTGDTLFYDATPSAGNPSSATYYVSTVVGGGVQSVGAPFNGQNTGYTLEAGLFFNVLASKVTIDGVYVYPLGTGAGTIEIGIKETSSGNIIHTTTVSVVGSNPGVRTYIPLGFTIPAGTDYQMLWLNKTGGVSGLVRDGSADITGGGYPFTIPGVISITEGQCCFVNDVSTSYYYFYDWQLSGGCESDRTMAVAEVQCVVGLEDNNAVVDNALNIYPNPSAGLFSLSITSSKKENYNLSVTDVKGKLVYQENVNVNGSYQKDLDFRGFSKGVYYMQIQSDEKLQVEKLIIQ